ncbi:MAG TPA: hypothetical protein V6D18_20855 [Thermosynechococcaceae cyanobacterium]
MKRHVLKLLTAGGALLLALSLLIDLRLPSFGTRRSEGEACQEVVQERAKLSRSQLAKLLTISEGNKKQQIREVVKEPYCKLTDLQVRVGAIAQREAYPLEFDPQTWFIVLYEGDQYAGYRFSFRQGS